MMVLTDEEKKNIIDQVHKDFQWDKLMDIIEAGIKIPKVIKVKEPNKSPKNFVSGIFYFKKVRDEYIKIKELREG